MRGMLVQDKRVWIISGLRGQDRIWLAHHQEKG